MYAQDMDQYLNEPLIYSLSGSPMFQIVDENTADVSVTPHFDPDTLPKNGIVLFLKVSQVFHSVWKLLKMSHLNISILAFSTNLCPIKLDLSGNTVNIARFARNVKCDFFCDFQTLWDYVKKLA